MSTINDIMLKALQNATSKLNEEANLLIKEFILTQLHKDGGFKDRNNKPDLYYSVFGYSLLYIYNMDMDTEKQLAFLKKQQKEDLDLVHAVSLIRCFLLIEAIKLKQSSKLASVFSGFEHIQNIALQKIIIKAKKECAFSFDIIQNYISLKEKNSFGKNKNSETIYDDFLVWSLLQDINKEAFRITEKLYTYRLSDGSFVNEINSAAGITTTTAAGLIMSLEIGDKSTQKTIDWIINRMDKYGGFSAAENIPLADVLSTATALTSLKIAGVNMKQFAQSADFINLHWDTSGGFFGSIADMYPDIEYTFYALLTLGMI